MVAMNAKTTHARPVTTSACWRFSRPGSMRRKRNADPTMSDNPMERR